MKIFNPDNNYLMNNGLFGLPFSYADSKLVIIPVPWEVTVSYGNGTSNAPDAVYKASFQIDLFDSNLGEVWKKGIFLESAPEYIYDDNAVQRRFAKQIIHHYENEDKALNDRQLKHVSDINKACESMNDYVGEMSRKIHAEGKLSALLGGDHSTALEHIKAVAKREKEIGLIQIDAHADLREAYLGFTYSHASLMHNLLQDHYGIKNIVQMGLRDICSAEYEVMQKSSIITPYFMSDIRKKQYEGNTLREIFFDMINGLPEKVYISLDIDGMDPSLCPNTGTPVPGGFHFHEISFLLQLLLESGRKIVGFDLCEVSPADNNEWDANVAARLLYQLSIHTLQSNG